MGGFEGDQRESILGSIILKAKIHRKILLPDDSRQKETHGPSVIPTAWCCRGSLSPATGLRLRSAQIRSGNLGRGLHCGQTGRPAPSPGPFALLPHDQASPRSYSPFSPSLPSPQTHTKQGHPPPQTLPTFPSPPLFPPLRSTQKLQARRLLRTAPIFPSRVLFSLTGEGRPEEGEARSRGGRRSSRSARSCFPACQREKKERRTSRLRARRRPLYRAALAGARATPASASIPPPPPPAPRFPRAVPHSASSSHAAAQGYGPAAVATGLRQGLPARCQTPSLGAASCAVMRGSGGRAHGLCVETPGYLPGEQKGVGNERPPSDAFQWDSFLGRRLRPSLRRA